MDNLMKGRTVFVIAHRLSTVRNSDAIMVLDHGRIIERGDHDRLMERRGTYYRLYIPQYNAVLEAVRTLRIRSERREYRHEKAS